MAKGKHRDLIQIRKRVPAADLGSIKRLLPERNLRVGQRVKRYEWVAGQSVGLVVSQMRQRCGIRRKARHRCIELSVVERPSVGTANVIVRVPAQGSLSVVRGKHVVPERGYDRAG